jgi:hypothetical protein
VVDAGSDRAHEFLLGPGSVESLLRHEILAPALAGGPMQVGKRITGTPSDVIVPVERRDRSAVPTIAGSWSIDHRTNR